MSKKSKRLERLRNASPAGAPSSLVVQVLTDHGFQWTQGGTNHRVFSHPLGVSLTLPMDPVARHVYVKLALRAIDKAIEGAQKDPE